MKELLRDRAIEVLKSVGALRRASIYGTPGLIHEVSVNDKGVIRIMTFTAPACPIAKHTFFEICSEISLIEGFKDLEVDVVFDPRRTPLNMTPGGERNLN